jgi:hypothetical protein
MRSIGAWKIKKLKVICKEELEKAFGDGSWRLRSNLLGMMGAVKMSITDRIPNEWYDTWESAWSEIERLIDDEINNYQYRRA